MKATVVTSGPTGIQQVEAAAEAFAQNILLTGLWAYLAAQFPVPFAIPFVGGFIKYFFMYFGNQMDITTVNAIGDQIIAIRDATQAAQETTQAGNLAGVLDNPGATPDEIAAAQKAFEDSLGNIIHFDHG